jgi:hypothetical protein
MIIKGVPSPLSRNPFGPNRTKIFFELVDLCWPFYLRNLDLGNFPIIGSRVNSRKILKIVNRVRKTLLKNPCL